MKPLLITILIFFQYNVSAQHVQRDLPPEIHPKKYYLFYLHGGVVTVKGDNAINDPVPHFGPYQYSRILDTLQAHGFQVISERRMPNVDDTVYALKIARQIDTLLRSGVPEMNIMLAGASAGSHVVLLAAGKINNPAMKYVIMGGCWSELYKEYVNIKLPGKFLSIREQSDRRGSCANVFDNRKEVKKFEEVELNTGLDHGFIYRPFAAWIYVVTRWFEKNTRGYKARKASHVEGPSPAPAAQVELNIVGKELVLNNPPSRLATVHLLLKPNLVF
jgi:hypothetical protein